jgi:signal transduction histidine kinase
MFLLLQVLWIPVVMGRALRNKAPGVYLVLIGAVSCCGAAVWDVLVAKQVFSGYFMMQYAVAIFMISQSEVVAQRAALAFRKSRQLAKDLKFEMQARVMMVSDLAHRTNNPLNYITTGVNSLRQEVIEQHQDIQELFANLDRNDPDNLAVINHFDQKYRAMLEAIDSMSHGVQRSANSVTEIRTMSGVDGYSLVPVLWKDVLLAAKLRLKENIGYKADCLYLKTDEVEDLQVRSNATALTLALELIFRLWVGRALHDVVVSFRQEGNAQREFCKIHMDCAWNDHAADDTDKEQVENLAYIIQPYGCSLELSEDLKRISFRFELTTKTVALADAS